ncbi:MAG: FliM/FliN family flagellar motor switch protein [Acidobacteriota bacterium]
MEKALSQDEINALSRVAAEGRVTSRVTAKGGNCVPFVFGKASSISKQQVRDVAQIHEAFIYNLGNRLSSSLQVSAEVIPASVDELPYSDFVQTIPNGTYLASLEVWPTHSLAILSLDLSIALATIDLMLGGSGKPAPVQRQITEIEEKVLQMVLDMICEELKTTWRQVVEVNFSFDRSHRAVDLFRLMPSYEKILLLTFEIRMTSLSGTLTLAFPATASSLLVRNLAKKGTRTQGRSPEFQVRLQKRLKESVYRVEVLLPPTRIRGGDLLSLKAGQTLLIQHSVSEPAAVRVAGCKMFSAFPVRIGRRRGGLVHEKFPISFSSEKVSE